MGRPKGSLNRRDKKPIIKLKRKRGRPKEIKKVEEEVVPPSDVKISKFLGYCPRCWFMMNKRDLETKFIYVCPGCGNRGRVNMLKKVKSPHEKMSKRDYLEATLNAEYYDMPPMNAHDVGDLKIQDT